MKHIAFETERFPLHDPIDGEALCKNIAARFDEVLAVLWHSAKEHNIEITATGVSFEPDTEDLRHPSGYFRVIARGVEKEDAK